MPSTLWSLGRRMFGPRRDRFAYVSDDKALNIPASAGVEYWSSKIAEERAAFAEIKARATAAAPFDLDAYPAERAKYAAFGYTLGLAANQLPKLRVLDYGGNLGDYYWIGRSLVPGIDLEYHCRELPQLADVGRAINPAVTWHTDDRCLTGRYDVVLFSSSMQYVAVDAVVAASQAATRYLLLLDVPAVRDVSAFYSTQESGDATTVQRHPNCADTIAMFEADGWRLVREFDMGDHPRVEHAPEQPHCVGWLFRRVPAS